MFTQAEYAQLEELQKRHPKATTVSEYIRTILLDTKEEV